MAGQVVRVKRNDLEACMTCPICNKVLKEATTISLCLHTFCRKCINDKLSDEDTDCCPVCDIDLGCVPEDKLRTDHILQDIRAKIFPLKKRKINAPEVTLSFSPPAKRKERSLSSLVVTAPKVPTQCGFSGRKRAHTPRNSAAYNGSTDEELHKKEDSSEDRPTSSSSPDGLKRSSQNKRRVKKSQVFSADPSKDQRSNAETDKSEEKTDLWAPLNCLVEAANRTKSPKFNSQGPSFSLAELNHTSDHERTSENKAKKESSKCPDREMCTSKVKNKDNGHNTKGNDVKNILDLHPGPVKRRRLRCQKPVAVSEDMSGHARIMLEAAGAKFHQKDSPIWFTLVASEDQREAGSLPMIPTIYLRIKDGKMPVSYIQKYLVKKLDLTSEVEVEIMCRGEPVLPSLQLHNLVDLWFRTASTSKKVPASVGSSAKDFVMVLSYCRKI